MNEETGHLFWKPVDHQDFVRLHGDLDDLLACLLGGFSTKMEWGIVIDSTGMVHGRAGPLSVMQIMRIVLSAYACADEQPPSLVHTFDKEYH